MRFVSFRAMLPSLLLAFAIAHAAVQAADLACDGPGTGFGLSALPPVGRYADYAASGGAAAAGDEKREATSSGRPLAGIPCDGYSIVSAASAQTTLAVPSGWVEVDDGKSTAYFTPDRSVRIVIGFRDLGGASFAQGKATLHAQLLSQFKGKDTRIETLDLSDGGFALKLSGIATATGLRSALLVYSPSPARSGYATHLSLSAASEQFDRYLGLAGLILRDRKVNWASSAAPDLDARAEQSRYREVAMRAVSALAAGNEDEFIATMSTRMLKANGIEFARELARQVHDAVFVRFARLDSSETVSQEPEGVGPRAFAFYLTAISQDDHRTPFVIQVIDDGGRPGVSVVAPDVAPPGRGK